MSLFCLVHGSTQNATGMGNAGARATAAEALGDLCEPTYRRTGSERNPVRTSHCGGVAKFYRGSRRCGALCEWSVPAAAPYALQSSKPVFWIASGDHPGVCNCSGTKFRPPPIDSRACLGSIIGSVKLRSIFWSKLFSAPSFPRR